MAADELPPPDPVIEVYKRDVDRTLLRKNLGLTVEERLRQHVEFLRFAEQLRAATRSARGGSPQEERSDREG